MDLAAPDRRHQLDGDRIGHPGVGQRLLLAHAATSVPGAAELARLHPANRHYDQRALLMAAPDDLVCVLDGVEPDYLAFLGSLGLGPTTGNVLVVPHGGHASLTDAMLAQRDALALAFRHDPRPVLVAPFLAGGAELALVRHLAEASGRPVRLQGEPGITALANRKDQQRRWAIELGVPVADGEIVQLEGQGPNAVAALERAVVARLAAGESVLVRGSDGASGSATRIVRGAADLAALSAWVGTREETCYLVDRLEPLVVSPNLLFFVPRSGEPRFVAATDQILDAGLHHSGNAFPSRAVLLDEMIAHAETLACHLQRIGYLGWVGFDFCECRDPRSDERRLLFAELNPRINGASYPVAAASRLQRSGGDIGAFRSAYLRTDATSFSSFARRFGEHLMRRPGEPGCVPFNTGCLPHGYCAVLTLDRDTAAVDRRWEQLCQAAQA